LTCDRKPVEMSMLLALADTVARNGGGALTEPCPSSAYSSWAPSWRLLLPGSSSNGSLDSRRLGTSRRIGAVARRPTSTTKQRFGDDFRRDNETYLMRALLHSEASSWTSPCRFDFFSGPFGRYDSESRRSPACPEAAYFFSVYLARATC